MGILVRAVITGFGLSLGKLLFEKAQEQYLERVGQAKADDDDEIIDAVEVEATDSEATDSDQA